VRPDVADAHRSFFHLVDADIVDQICQGTACFVARHRDPARWARAEESQPRVYCLGKCYAGPAAATDTTQPRVVIDAREPVLLGRVATGGAPTFDSYRADGGYATLERVVTMAPDAVLADIEVSKLRGRGGAAFATVRKWRAVQEQPGDRKYVVCNADEGDPGAFSDRILLEGDPHLVLEGLAIAAVAVGAERGFVYVRKEYPQALAAIRRAVAEARAAGVLGASLLGDGPAFDVEVVTGEGSYVCGEETALLNALEGRRPEVRARPPYPAERGLLGRPTLVQNVETLAAVPWILRRGGAAYAAMGAAESRGTKLLSLSSLFCRPGLYEVEMGVTVAEIVDRLGGGVADGDLRGVLIGGPLAGMLPRERFDVPLDFEALRRLGCEVGHGGVVAVDEHTEINDLVHHVFRFGAYESCGKCTPCREGAGRIERRFDRAVRGDPSVEASGEWIEIVSALAATSLCGHGTGLAAFARSMTQHFGGELG
jgi:NADH:ubiquinone oxidoreductase subunit F (NADH-binding)